MPAIRTRREWPQASPLSRPTSLTRPGLSTGDRQRQARLEKENRAAPGERDLEDRLGLLRGGARPSTAGEGVHDFKCG